jgi:Family of unknown function (DUF6941)/Tetratricopeptide repeat
LEATVFFLADYAVAHADGKFYITGGFLRTIKTPLLPMEYSHLSLGVRIEFAADDLQGAHLVEIHSSGPANRGFVKPYSLRYRPPQVEHPEPAVLQFVYHMDDVPFSQEGDYSLALLVDDQPLAKLTFQVEELRLTSDRDTPWSTPLQEGVVAFSMGETAIAESLFREVVEHHPEVAEGHNNLGFILLSQGQAAEAREEFVQASRFNFDRDELLDANVACCDYLLHDYAAALSLFEGCLTALPFTAPSVLFGISEGELFPVSLRSAADYLALMLLNAAWSALRAHAPRKAREYAHRAADFELLTHSMKMLEPPPIARSLTLILGQASGGKKST